MASQIVGRKLCGCGHSGHIKRRTDKEGARIYFYCPECHTQTFCRNDNQERVMSVGVEWNAAELAKKEPDGKDKVPAKEVKKEEKKSFLLF